MKEVSSKFKDHEFRELFMNWQGILFLAGSLIASCGHAETVSSAPALYNQTTQIVTQNFYDRTFRGLQWGNLVERYRARTVIPMQKESFVRTINELLSHLKASHTEFLSDDDQEYWALESIFSHTFDRYPTVTIGSWFMQDDGKWFVQDVLEGSPAEKAGLLKGDEIVSVDGRAFEPVHSFEGSQGGRSKVLVRRKRDGGTMEYLISTNRQSFSTDFYDATARSARTIERNGVKIGYFHLWAGTNEKFKTAMLKAIEKFRTETEAMVLDLRDGFGGTDPSYLTPFFNTDENGHTIEQVYSKPLVVLINGGVRSGKEWITFILKTKKRGVLVGNRTAGCFLGGRLFQIEEGRFALYLAVSGDGPEGVDLEGKGVEADIEVPMDIPYLEGKDAQLERGLATAIGLIKGKRGRN